MPDLDPRRKKLFDAMVASINRPAETQQIVNPSISLRPQPGAVDPGYNAARGLPSPLPTTAPANDLPDAVASPSHPAPPIRIHIGADTGGLQGVEKSLAELRTQQQAARDYPSSKVVDGAVLPPKMHHGLGDKLKSIGKGIVINMGEYARTHPGAETAELLGAGGAGGVVGGISPVSIDALQSQAALKQKQADVGSQIGLEQEAAQTEAMRQKPLNDAERIAMENRRIEEAARREDEKMRETADYHRATIEERKTRPRAERPPLIRERTKADGSKVSLRSDDNGKTWVEIPELADEAKAGTDNSDLVRNYDKRIGEYQSKAADLRQQATNLTEAAKTDATAADDRNRLMKEAAEADDKASELRGKRDEADAKPKAQSAAPSPSTHVLSKSEWLKTHDAKDWPKAVAAAKEGQYQIVK